VFLEHRIMSRVTPLVWVAIVCALATAGCSPAAPPPQPPAVVRPAPAAADAAVVKNAEQPAATEQPAEQQGAPATNLDELRRKLAATTDAAARMAVIDEIAAIGQNARPALDDLVKAAGDEDVRVRWHAARGIGLIGEDASSALPLLVKLLDDREWVGAAQSAAAIALIRKDEAANTITAADAEKYAAAREALVKATVHADPRVRRSAIRAVRVLSPEPEVLAPLVCKQLSDADPSVVLPALHSLADMGDEALPLLMEAVKHPRSRYWATIALTEMGEAAAPATDLLAKEVEEGELDEKLQAILALAAIGPKAARTAPLVAKALESQETALRFAAAFALGKLRAAEGDGPLERAAADPDECLASVASWARAQLHPDDSGLLTEAVARLRKGLDNESATIREGSAASLSDLAGRLDGAGRKALAAEFADLLNDADPAVSLAAGAGLIRLGGAAVEALRPRLADPAVRSAVLEILAAIGPAAKPALDDLLKGLSDADPVHRGETVIALAALGSDAQAAVPQLQNILAAADAAPELRYTAAYALGRIGPAAKVAERPLLEMSQSKDELMATVAVWALLNINPEEKTHVETAIPLLRRALRGDRELVRIEAAVALGDIGAAATAAVPILELVSEDDSSKAVRSAAAEALAKIRAAAGPR
jgi:HEAT repeat protein